VEIVNSFEEWRFFDYIQSFKWKRLISQIKEAGDEAKKIKKYLEESMEPGEWGNELISGDIKIFKSTNILDNLEPKLRHQKSVNQYIYDSFISNYGRTLSKEKLRLLKEKLDLPLEE